MSRVTATIDLFGVVSAGDYPKWIRRHADKLGLTGLQLDQGERRMRVIATGPEEMLNALSLGCSLGPESVLVERVHMETAPSGHV